MDTRVPKNIPNILTLFRFALVPVVFVMIWIDHMILAFAFFALACLTDILDGYIARHYNMITNAGKLLDPLADKVMVVVVLLGLTLFPPNLPPFIFIVLCCLELVMVVGGIFLYDKNIVTPGPISMARSRVR